MSYKVPNCEDCDSKLEYYEEILYTIYKKINKDGTISKISKQDVADSNYPWGLRCIDCDSYYYYELDEKNRVINVRRK